MKAVSKTICLLLDYDNIVTDETIGNLFSKRCLNNLDNKNLGVTKYGSV